MESLFQIFNRHGSDKREDFHNYCRQYESLLSSYRGRDIKMLEIGVFNGESLKIFREVFQNSKIVGIDIDQRCKQYQDTDNNIFIEIGDASNNNFCNEICSKYGPFDVILDDGSHVNRDVILSFESLFPLMADNGLYIVEDTICYKSSNHIDNSFPDHLNYFFPFTKHLNQWRYDSEQGIKDNCVDPFKIIKKTDNPFEYSIDKIEYGCSYIAIHKKIRHHWIRLSDQSL